ncbi:MAG TPA: DUF4190 domain-containing protein [Candidatus Dojkabacteria bacterium]|nr:DUF4190 domain-containing protein [Candidatus Dojkabacteria bacterium]
MQTKYNESKLSEEYLESVRAEGATDSDIESWWNLTEVERALIIKDDIVSRMAVFIDAKTKGLSDKKAMDEVKKAFPIFDIDFYKKNKEDGQNRPLPYELKDKINLHMLELANEIGLEKLKKEVRKYPTFNSYIRNFIEREHLENQTSKSTTHNNNLRQETTQTTKKNSLAIISFILSILAPFTGFSLLGILGLFLGILSLNQIKVSNENGKGLAITAIIIGSIWGVLKLIVDVLLLL